LRKHRISNHYIEKDENLLDNLNDSFFAKNLAKLSVDVDLNILASHSEKSFS
jgi:hypothetical protein